jgi:iron(III) transport system substrate-binding protein
MALKKFLSWATAALLLLYATVLAVQAASVESFLSEINRLPPAERQKRLEEGARREGSFVHYSVSNAELINAYVKAFMNKYPFIKADFWRGSGNQLVFRILMEHRAGKLAADVISVGTENVITLKKAGLYARYRSPENQFYPREQYDKEGYFSADSLGLATIAYNNQLVKKDDAPKGYDDLLDPKWKGTLTIDLDRSGR